jgi:protein-tyrosine phosphatase
MLNILLVKGKPQRTVTQMQFLEWPDKLTPGDPWSLLAFHHRVRSLLNSAPSSRGPLLVHCSAGVGRTGTFIALDTLLNEADKTGTVDIFDVVKYLRLQRMASVQVLASFERKSMDSFRCISRKDNFSYCKSGFNFQLIAVVARVFPKHV